MLMRCAHGQLKNSGQTPTEEIQLGSLLKGIPGLFEVINKTKEKVNPVQDKKIKKDRTDTLYEHACKGHPYDPMCPACIRSRMTAKHNTQNTDDDKVQGSDKSAVLGIGYIGPYIPDVDGNVLAMTGVDAGRTNCGMVRLCKDQGVEPVFSGEDITG